MMNKELQQKINRVLRRSVRYAFDHPDSVMPYVRAHAQAMEDAVMKAHIDLYVTAFTEDLGEKGRQAVTRLFELAREKQIIPNHHKNIFID